MIQQDSEKISLYVEVLGKMTVEIFGEAIETVLMLSLCVSGGGGVVG